MRAQGRHVTHQGLDATECNRRRQRVCIPARGAYRAPAVTAGQHRMVRQLLDVVHPRVGDTGEPQALLEGVGAYAPGRRADDRLEFVAVCDPVGIRREPGVGDQLGRFQYDFAEALPFGRILHRQQHRVAITGNERPVRRNRRVARSRE